jgi:hypothetical protein
MRMRPLLLLLLMGPGGWLGLEAAKGAGAGISPWELLWLHLLLAWLWRQQGARGGDGTPHAAGLPIWRLVLDPLLL